MKRKKKIAMKDFDNVKPCWNQNLPILRINLMWIKTMNKRIWKRKTMNKRIWKMKTMNKRIWKIKKTINKLQPAKI